MTEKNSKMKGGIVKRAGRYSIVYRVPDPLTGKTKQRWETLREGSSWKEARTLRGERLKAVDQNIYVNKDIGFSELVDKWLASAEQNELKESSIQFYKGMGKHMKQYFGNTSVKNIGTEQVEAYLASKIGSLSARSRGYHLATIKQIFEKAKAWNYVYTNPADNLKRPKVKAKKIIVPTAEMVATLLEYATGQTRLLLLTAANTGCRAGELLALKWRNVDLVEGTISIDATEGNFIQGRFTSPKTEASVRTIDLTPSIVNALAVAKDSSVSDLVFPNSTGRPQAWTNFLQRQFTPLLKKADLPHITPHCLRHFYAVQLFKAGLNPVYIKEQLGHSNLTTTLDIYADHLPKKVKGMGQKIEAALELNISTVEIT